MVYWWAYRFVSFLSREPPRGIQKVDWQIYIQVSRISIQHPVTTGSPAQTTHATAPHTLKTAFARDTLLVRGTSKRFSCSLCHRFPHEFSTFYNEINEIGTLDTTYITLPNTRCKSLGIGSSRQPLANGRAGIFIIEGNQSEWGGSWLKAQHGTALTIKWRILPLSVGVILSSVTQ
jgi:hypothetical protein